MSFLCATKLHVVYLADVEKASITGRSGKRNYRGKLKTILGRKQWKRTVGEKGIVWSGPVLFSFLLGPFIIQALCMPSRDYATQIASIDQCQADYSWSALSMGYCEMDIFLLQGSVLHRWEKQ